MPPRKMDSNDETNTEDVTTDPAPEGYISLAQLEELLTARDKQHAEELAVVKARVPIAIVPANAGGPGNDQHQDSWSLAEQEVAAKGEVLDHWVI
jgi:hypothetical protein